MCLSYVYSSNKFHRARELHTIENNWILKRRFKPIPFCNIIPMLFCTKGFASRGTERQLRFIWIQKQILSARNTIYFSILLFFEPRALTKDWKKYIVWISENSTFSLSCCHLHFLKWKNVWKYILTPLFNQFWRYYMKFRGILILGIHYNVFGRRSIQSYIRTWNNQVFTLDN